MLYTCIYSYILHTKILKISMYNVSQSAQFSSHYYKLPTYIRIKGCVNVTAGRQVHRWRAQWEALWHVLARHCPSQPYLWLIWQRRHELYMSLLPAFDPSLKTLYHRRKYRLYCRAVRNTTLMNPGHNVDNKRKGLTLANFM